mmetsp:Transcript_2156/g.1922  ORF Transcript_2156/g.1922 Transcript_2156/m.1922 type:complete len:161 (-) Transcript_2156:31-513(-)
MNLVSNSLKFTHKGGIFINISKVRRFDRDEFKSPTYLEFKIEDTGSGIKGNKKDLFKLFGKLNNINKNINERGTGLGLTICKKLTNLLGGDINIESEEHKGTEAIFLIKHNPEIKSNEQGSQLVLNSSINQFSQRSFYSIPEEDTIKKVLQFKICSHKDF